MNAVKLKRYGRMSAAEEQKVIFECGKWERGDVDGSLTWGSLATLFGFSRQALQDKPAIMAAYKSAKQALKDGTAKTRAKLDEEVAGLQTEISRLRAELSAMKEKERLWKLRWQRIAFNIRQAGVQVVDIDKDVPNASLPTQQATSNILRPFDRDIPPSPRK
jgi:uncharacterized small protein (DUF1192 family)